MKCRKVDVRDSPASEAPIVSNSETYEPIYSSPTSSTEAPEAKDYVDNGGSEGIDGVAVGERIGVESFVLREHSAPLLPELIPTYQQNFFFTTSSSIKVGVNKSLTYVKD